MEDLVSLFGGVTVKSLVGGDLVAGKGAGITLIDPASEEPIVTYPDAGAEVAEAALAAAETGGRAWRAMSPTARGQVLAAAARLVMRDADKLAALEARFGGKPIRDARAEVAKVAEMLTYYAGWADKITGDVLPVATSHLTYVLREPLGTIVQITPWNAPIFTAGWQIAPALAAGNAVVLKPSENTPVTSVMLGLIMQEAGVPAGAINVIAGLGATAGARLVGDPRCGKAVFIGSVATGRKVAALAAAAGRPSLLELGGKSAMIVFADADLRRAAKAAQGAIFANAGQSCTAGARLLVERPAYERMVEWVAQGAGRLKVGSPLDPATEVGPVQNARQYAHVLDLLKAGRAEGARIVAGGWRPEDMGDRGFFIAPTVLADARGGMRVVREEIFGPVLTVMPFDGEGEAVALANEGEFDLAGAVWTGDVGRAHRVAAALRAGSVWVNGYRTLSVMAPFGGMRGSGFGRSSGYDVLMEYTQAKAVWVETAADAPLAFGYGPAD
jgi:acyl-CoA reductase-like NAD-dependent aldehyde dehydrogenase